MPQIIKKIKYNLLLFVPQLSCFAGHPKEKEAFTSGSPVQRRKSFIPRAGRFNEVSRATLGISVRL